LISYFHYYCLASNQLPYINLNISDSSIPLNLLGHFDDGASDAISTNGGFPFGDTSHNYLFVCTQ